MTPEQQAAHDEGRWWAGELHGGQLRTTDPEHILLYRQSAVGVVLGMAAGLPGRVMMEVTQPLFVAAGRWLDHIGQHYPELRKGNPRPADLSAALGDGSSDPQIVRLLVAVEAAAARAAARCRDAGVERTPEQTRAAGFFERMTELRAKAGA